MYVDALVLEVEVVGVVVDDAVDVVDDEVVAELCGRRGTARGSDWPGLTWWSMLSWKQTWMS